MLSSMPSCKPDMARPGAGTLGAYLPSRVTHALLGLPRRVHQRNRARHFSALATDVAQAVVVSLPTADSSAPFQALFECFDRTPHNAKDRVRAILKYRQHLQPFADADKLPSNRVMGCTSQVWITAWLDQGHVYFNGTSDSELSQGLVGMLVSALSGLTTEEIMQIQPSILQRLQLQTVLPERSRANAFANMLETCKRRARALVSQLPRFPSLIIRATELEPQGPFAEAQAQYLQPDVGQVQRLAEVLAAKKIGVVAHFYMDPEVQGVLAAAASMYPHIQMSDSLVMADTAVAMAAAGCQAIAVLGVDFMSENVRAVLDEAGHTQVQVYRMSPDHIGCSLAEAAESDAYVRYLSDAATTPKSLHVVYINTSLRTKALADAIVPTITCTSSNVVQTILQTFAQEPDATIWYGPDTYMGRNLAQLFQGLASSSDEVVKAIHPAHTAASIRSSLQRFKYFEDGTCIVHHIFGGEVCEIIKQCYGDAFITAHFEVPGDMFTLAMEAKTRDRGVVGSTSNILDFICAKVTAALAAAPSERLQFVLGTESGMITSIVNSVQRLLQASGRSDVDVEIVFPVAAAAITTAEQGRGPNTAAVELPNGLALLPGPAGGEGCASDGGCAACPYMRMNSLTALFNVCTLVGSPLHHMLSAYEPQLYSEMINGKTVAQAGCVPILHMRHFQKQKQLSDGLIQDMLRR